jgi:hypothetical protein
VCYNLGKEETMDTTFTLLRLEGMLTLAKGWLESTPLEKDAVNHLRFFMLVGDLESAIRAIKGE